MAFISWRKDYELGVPSVDADHKQLFALINDFHEALAAGAQSRHIAQVLNRLTAYAEEHFRREERLMMDNGYPRLEQHREQHASLVVSIFSINERLATDPNQARREVLAFVKHWLIEHIVKSDMDIADFLKRKAAQASRVQAQTGKDETQASPGSVAVENAP